MESERLWGSEHSYARPKKDQQFYIRESTDGAISPLPSTDCGDSQEELDQIDLVLEALLDTTPVESAISIASAIQVDLVGSWVDSYGNSVVVHQSGNPNAEVTASLSKPGKQDIIFGLWQEPGDGAWHCGDAILDKSMSAANEVTWVFCNGCRSVWKRQEPSCVSETLWGGNADWQAMGPPAVPYTGWEVPQPCGVRMMIFVPVLLPISNPTHGRENGGGKIKRVR